MPGLNFLKKIRSKEGHHEHSNGPTSPNATKQTQQTQHHQQPQAGGIGNAGAAQGFGPGGQGQQQHGGEGATVTAGAPPHVDNRRANDGALLNSEQPQPSPSNISPGAAPPPPPYDSRQNQNQQQNSPSIHNLVNAPQDEGAPTSNPTSNQHSSPFNKSALNLGPSLVPTVSASPGTDPAALQKQQQAALPPPRNSPPSQQQQQQGEQPTDASHDPDAMQTDQPEQQSQPAEQLQQNEQPQQTQAVPQQQQQQHHHQHQPHQQQHAQSVSGHQHQGSTSSTPRITKGKYTLNDFDMLRTLGTGSFGRVHLVQSKHNQRFYAIKVLKKAQVVKMKQVEHTNDERRMLSDVKHPFLVTLWGTFTDVKNLYMVMDFVEGGELFSLLRKSGRFPNPVAKFYAAEVTLALEYMHAKHIIYRDLKPENLLLDRHGHLKITDFGFAKRVPDKTWTLCGTPDYLAPEVVSNKGYNKSVDWWSLGILIYEMLCGYTPFWDSGSPMRIYENILKGKVKYPSYIAPEAQDLLQKLITADLSKRLGNLYGGSNDVKNHPWFHEVTWDRLARKDIDAPYTPPVKAGAGDASQFDKYPEEHEKYGQLTGTDEYGHLFSEF